MFNQDIFAQRVRMLRKNHKLKQEDIGKLIKVSKAQISEIERGNKTTSIENLIILADYFNVSIDYLTGRTDNPDISSKSTDLITALEEKQLLEDFRILNKHEQNIIIGRISEMIYNKNIENTHLIAAEEIAEYKDKLNK